MRDRRGEIHQHPVARDVYVLGIDHAELLERDRVFRIGDGAE
jgi:hypothetical protein